MVQQGQHRRFVKAGLLLTIFAARSVAAEANLRARNPAATTRRLQTSVRFLCTEQKKLLHDRDRKRCKMRGRFRRAGTNNARLSVNTHISSSRTSTSGDTTHDRKAKKSPCSGNRVHVRRASWRCRRDRRNAINGRSGIQRQRLLCGEVSS